MIKERTKQSRTRNTEVPRAPGIGRQGEVVTSNHDTRAVFVAPDLITGEEQIERYWSELLQDPKTQRHDPSRLIVKGVSYQSFEHGTVVNGAVVEASLAFPTEQGMRHWLVVGRNQDARDYDPVTRERQRAYVRRVVEQAKYRPQSGEQLLAFVTDQMGRPSELHLERVSDENIARLLPAIKDLYGKSFNEYPYDVVEVIQEIYEENVFVVARRKEDEVLAITGAEMMRVAGHRVAEIGDSAAVGELDGSRISGFGALMKRVLLQELYDSGNIPDIAFTDSRFGNVLPANRRAGFQLDPRIYLPWHTQIAADERDPCVTCEIAGNDGRHVVLENMTMTWVTGSEITDMFESAPNFWRVLNGQFRLDHEDRTRDH